MINTKAVVLLLAAAVVVAAVVGIAFAQYAIAQANSNGNVNQVPQGTVGGYYAQQGYPYGSAQYGSSYGQGRGMGICGRLW